MDLAVIIMCILGLYKIVSPTSVYIVAMIYAGLMLIVNILKEVKKQ